MKNAKYEPKKGDIVWYDKKNPQPHRVKDVKKGEYGPKAVLVPVEGRKTEIETTLNLDQNFGGKWSEGGKPKFPSKSLSETLHGKKGSLSEFERDLIRCANDSSEHVQDAVLGLLEQHS